MWKKVAQQAKQTIIAKICYKTQNMKRLSFIFSMCEFSFDVWKWWKECKHTFSSSALNILSIDATRVAFKCLKTRRSLKHLIRQVFLKPLNFSLVKKYRPNEQNMNPSQ